MTQSKTLLIAGGGTGGHIFSGVAVAEKWQDLGGRVEFVGTPRGKESEYVPKEGFQLHLIPVGRLKGTGVLQKIKTLLSIPKALIKAYQLIKQIKPKVILGIGGYASGPVCLMGRLMGYPTAVIDQNAYPGLTNRTLGKIAHQVFLSFKESERFFNSKKVKITGNPIRSKVSPHPYPSEAGLNLFIFGGSQGAVGMNQKVMDAIDQLKDNWDELSVTHQAGKTDLDKVKKFYQDRKIKANVDRFFWDIDSEYKKAHLVICRSGAGTVTEMAIAGRPAVFIPFPYAADNHQFHNAKAYVEAGGAWCFEQKDLSSKALADLLIQCLKSKEDLISRAEKMKSLARPQAAEDVARELWKMNV